MTRSRLGGADLGGADLRNAILRSANFCGASLRGASLSGAIVDRNTSFAGVRGVKSSDSTKIGLVLTSPPRSSNPEPPTLLTTPANHSPASPAE